MSLVIVDVESDGPYPPDYSMICFGAVIYDKTLKKTFYGQCRPISENWIPGALAVSGFSREKTMLFPLASTVMAVFAEWLSAECEGRPVFVSDNPAYDFQFINYYFFKFFGSNPFGYSGRRIGDLYCGMKMDTHKNKEWKKRLRKTTHSHDPVDDAMGNAEALLAMEKMGLKI